MRDIIIIWVLIGCALCSCSKTDKQLHQTINDKCEIVEQYWTYSEPGCTSTVTEIKPEGEEVK